MISAGHLYVLGVVLFALGVIVHLIDERRNP